MKIINAENSFMRFRRMRQSPPAKLKASPKETGIANFKSALEFKKEAPVELNVMEK